MVVVDGASEDQTAKVVADRFPEIPLIQLPTANRAVQMNAGARCTFANVLWFLHADMRPPQKAIQQIRRALTGGAVGGGFYKQYEPTHWLLTFYGWLLNHLYIHGGGGLVGTNGIFVHRDTFNSIGGFPEVPFMEDAQFGRRLAAMGKLQMLKDPIRVSARRYWKHGILNQIVRNILFVIRERWFKEDPRKLGRLYHGEKSTRKR